MQTFFFFSKEHPELAKAELLSLLKGEVIEMTNEYCIAENPVIPRLVMTKIQGELLAVTNPKNIKLDLEFQAFAVRAEKMSGCETTGIVLEREVGQKIKGKVNLSKPKTVIQVFCGKKLFVVKKEWGFELKKMIQRQVNARPCVNPSSLQPKFARLLINLSGRSKRILDPFCGVGGIMIETGLLGLEGVGVELDEKWFEGLNENLWFFRVENKIKTVHGDFLKAKLGSFDAIVTDLPYGKSSGLFGKKLEELYEKSFVKMREHSKKLVVMGAMDLTPFLKKAGWKIKNHFRIYVHKTMERNLFVCEY